MCTSIKALMQHEMFNKSFKSFNARTEQQNDSAEQE
jgi:hypothetical protein